MIGLYELLGNPTTLQFEKKKKKPTKTSLTFNCLFYIHLDVIVQTEISRIYKCYNYERSHIRSEQFPGINALVTSFVVKQITFDCQHCFDDIILYMSEDKPNIHLMG